MAHHARIYTQLRPAFINQQGAVNYPIGSYSGGVREGTGDVRSLPVCKLGGINICLRAIRKQKNPILFFEKRSVIFNAP